MSEHSTAQDLISFIAKAQTELAQALSQVLELRADWVQDSFRRLDDLVTNYRSLGRVYHQTNIQARNSLQLNLDRRKSLEEMFTDFHAWSETVTEIQDLLKQMMLECRPNGTLEALRERCDRTRELQAEIQNKVSDDPMQSDTAMLYYAIEVDLTYLVLEDDRMFHLGLYTRWYEPTHTERGFQMPITLGVEWELFQQWVYTLPETRRSLFDHNKSLDMLTSEVLYETDKVYDSHWNAR